MWLGRIVVSMELRARASHTDARRTHTPEGRSGSERQAHERAVQGHGELPWRFTGGTIRRVAVDVSGEPYLDLERDAAAMLMRE